MDSYFKHLWLPKTNPIDKMEHHAQWLKCPVSISCEENFKCILKGCSKIPAGIKYGSLKTKQGSHKNSW